MNLFIKNTSRYHRYRASRHTPVFSPPHASLMALCRSLLCSILLCGIVPYSTATAQDYDAEPQPNRFANTASGLRSIAKRPEQQKKFAIGFNWGAAPLDSMVYKALRIQLIHSGSYNEADPSHEVNVILRNHVPWGTGYLYADRRFGHSGKALPYGVSASLQYDPVVSRRGSQYEFLERYRDTSGATWGFAQRDLEVGEVLPETFTASQNPNYNRMVLRDTNLRRANLQESLPATTPRLVLSDPRPNVLQLHDDIDKIRAEYFSWMLHGDSLYKNRSTEMFLRDYRIAGNPEIRIPIYKRDSTGNYALDAQGNKIPTTKAVPSWIDTAMRSGSTTIMHMKGDSSEWYVAANLRRMPVEAQLSVPANTPVLSIRVPFTVCRDTVFYDSTGKATATHKGQPYVVYAVFDSTAAVGSSIAEHNWYGAMDNALAASNDTTFVIRAGMLPSYEHLINNQIRPDITLSAHFWLPKLDNNSRYSNYRNVRLEFPNEPEPVALVVPPPPSGFRILPPVVLSVSMEVQYHGNVDIGLDWFRFEDRLARFILRGTKDDLMEFYTRERYNYLDNMAPDKNLWTYAHYIADEVGPPFWRTQRYISSVLEGVGTTETDTDWRGQYRHQAKDRHHWISWLNFANAISAPYFRFGAGWNIGNNTPTAVWAKRDDRSLLLGYGYKGMLYINSSNNPTPVLEDYETVLDADTQPIYAMSDSLYLLRLSKSHSVQSNVEYAMHSKIVFNRELSYGSLPVWYNSWVYSEWKTFDNPYNSDKATRPKAAYSSFTRPVTGEETRLMNWLALALGGKGLMPYKGGSSFNTTDDGQKKWEYGMSCYPSADGKTGRLNNAGQNTGTLGGDFLDNSHTIWSYINVDSSAAFMGIQTNRFYIGSASPMKQTILAHSFADDNSAELMRLQLQAVYSKGFKLVATQRDTSVHLERFVDTSATTTTSKFRVRRVHTRTGAAWTGGDEHFRDSTFFLLTLLKDSAKSMDEVFYLGVVNRRTDPTVYYPQAGGTSLGDSIKFFSTLEFDSLVTGGYLNSQYSKPAYAQEGARQITLPFNYQSPNGYALLRVEQMNGTLDTVLGQDQALALLFQPGEGKILRVSVLAPGTVPEGDIAYNGQRKMVVYPDPADPQKVRYHMVYHHGSEPKRQVYYRRSLPIERNSSEENIVWEPAVLLNKEVTDRSTASVLVAPDCAYPSIVVRHDPESGIERVSIAFACNEVNKGSTVADGQHVIVCNTFSASEPIVNLLNNQDRAGEVVAHASGDVLENWGTPVVGAAEQGNFYAWADSLLGIGIGYQEPHKTEFYSTIYTRWSPSSDSCGHPSISSYARASLDENSMALVWQEDNQIYYARPQFRYGVLDLQEMPFGNAVLNTPRTVMQLSEPACDGYNRMPVVYRSLETGAFRVSSLLGIMPLTYDCAYWESRSTPTDTRGKLCRTVVVAMENRTIPPLRPRGGFRETVSQIYGNYYRLFQPDVAQGAVQYSTNSSGIMRTNTSDSAYVLNFAGQYFFLPTNTSARLWHVPLRYSLTGQRPVSMFALPTSLLLNQGQNPHLAAQSTLQENSPWYVNRRVVQSGSTPDIVSSAQYFYRSPATRDDDALTPMAGFKKGCDKLLMIEPYVNNEKIAFADIETAMPNDTTVVVVDDTLRSQWFSIGGMAELSWYTMGSDVSFASLELVKKSDSSRQVIPIPATADTAVRLVKQVYTNGGGELYRLEFSKKYASVSYVQDMYVGSLPVVDASGNPVGYAKSGIEREVERGQVQNLALGGTGEQAGLHAYAYPNPARETVRLSLYRIYGESEAVTGTSGVEQLEVRILTALGKEVVRYRAKAGEVLELSVRDLPAGAYFVRVESLSSRSTEYGTTSFVVER